MSSVIFPSPNTYITPRSNEKRLESSNCELLLSQKMEKLRKFVKPVLSSAINYKSLKLRTIVLTNTCPLKHSLIMFIYVVLTIYYKQNIIKIRVSITNKFTNQQKINSNKMDDANAL